jgi:hypothetical protein
MVVVFALLFIFIALIPVGLSFLIFRYLRKKGYRLAGLVLIAAVTIWTVYSSYTAFYPTNGFYEAEFERNTNLDFPKSGYIVAKDASYPDLHGDYSAAALFRVDKNDFDRILSAIQQDPKFRLDTTSFGSRLGNLSTEIQEQDFSRSYIVRESNRDLIFAISFNDKNKLIEIQRDSW